MTKESAKPQPIAKQTVCSVCGLDWGLHAKRAPSLEGCIKLLRAELAKRPYPAFTTWSGGTAVQPGFTISNSAN